MIFAGRNVTLFGLPLLEHTGLRIRGAPDGVRTEHGAVLPVEIKSHRDVRRSDRLELAFYWLLLQGHRTRYVKQPQGVLVLRSPDGEEDLVVVDLQEHDFARVDRLIAAVREARRNGVQPAVCRCEVCVTRPEVIRFVREQKGTTLINGIARDRADILADLGIRTLEDILACDPNNVALHLQKHKHIVSAAMVETWKHHANSHLTDAPVVFGRGLLDFDAFIALDLEYVSARPGSIYLIGVEVAGRDASEFHQWWGDAPSEIAANLRALVDFINEHPLLPVVTWAGDDAEIPEFKKAAEKYGLHDLMRLLFERHFDLCDFMENNLRLPVKYKGLKDIERYFDVTRGTELSGGMQADSLYRRYRRSDDPREQQRIRRILEQYNEDDVHGLVYITRRFQELCRRQS